MDNDSRDSIIERIATVLAEVLTDAFERMRTDPMDARQLTDGDIATPEPPPQVVSGQDMVHRPGEEGDPQDFIQRLPFRHDEEGDPADLAVPAVIRLDEEVAPPGPEALDKFVGPMVDIEAEAAKEEAPPEPPAPPPVQELPEGVEPEGADVADPDVKGIVSEPPPQFVGGDEPVMLFGSPSQPDMFVPTDEQPMPDIIDVDPPGAEVPIEPPAAQQPAPPPEGEPAPPAPDTPPADPLAPMVSNEPDSMESEVEEVAEDGRYKVDDSIAEVARLTKELGDRIIESNKQTSRLLMKMVESIEDNRKRIQQIESRLERDRGYWL
jgi:hypothetical protein